MNLVRHAKEIRAGSTPSFPAEAAGLDYAQSLDAQDALKHMKDHFIIPTKASLKKKALDGRSPGESPELAASDDAACIYFAGHSLGAQSKAVRAHLHAQLETWASIGVKGHFTTLQNSPHQDWQAMASVCAAKMAPLVGAKAEEVVVMNGLTTNLHLLMATFYKPTRQRHKIMCEWKPFPSDWYAFQTQIRHHNIDPATSLVEMQPDGGEAGTEKEAYLSTAHILAAIDTHADETALLLLPGIQYYSGQLFDVATITAHAHAKGVPAVGWDLAHAVGNVELALHDWNVDFAAWCSYKYLNAGAGAIAGAFVHERHFRAVAPDRLAGWYGNDRASRFRMEKEFRPCAGAEGWTVSNPSVLDLAALTASLEVFAMTSMRELRDKALVLTAYAEWLLDAINADEKKAGREAAFKLLTPRNPLERGTQLSVKLREGLLDRVEAALEKEGVVCDKREPDIVRVAPVPMYCGFEDVWMFVRVFREALRM